MVSLVSQISFELVWLYVCKQNDLQGWEFLLRTKQCCHHAIMLHQMVATNWCLHGISSTCFPFQSVKWARCCFKSPTKVWWNPTHPTLCHDSWTKCSRRVGRGWFGSYGGLGRDGTTQRFEWFCSQIQFGMRSYWIWWISHLIGIHWSSLVGADQLIDLIGRSNLLIYIGFYTSRWNYLGISSTFLASTATGTSLWATIWTIRAMPGSWRHQIIKLCLVMWREMGSQTGKFRKVYVKYIQTRYKVVMMISNDSSSGSCSIILFGPCKEITNRNGSLPGLFNFNVHVNRHEIGVFTITWPIWFFKFEIASYHIYYHRKYVHINFQIDEVKFEDSSDLCHF